MAMSLAPRPRSLVSLKEMRSCRLTGRNLMTSAKWPECHLAEPDCPGLGGIECAAVAKTGLIQR